MRTIAALALRSAAPGGCASNKEYRALASSTGVYVENLKQGTNEFIAQQNALNAENASRLDRLAGERESAALAARGQAIAWTHAKDAPALATYQAATALPAEAIVAQMSGAATRAPALEDAGAADAYGKASEALAKLAAKPSDMDALLGLSWHMPMRSTPPIPTLRTRPRRTPPRPVAAATRPMTPSPNSREG